MPILERDPESKIEGAKAMTRTNDRTRKGGKKSGSKSAKKGAVISPDRGPTPIFVSYIYDFVGTDTGTGMAGDGGGRPGTIGGPIDDREPMYTVYTYPFLPPTGPDI